MRYPLFLIYVIALFLPACKQAGSSAKEGLDTKSITEETPKDATRHFWNRMNFEDTVLSHDRDFMEQNFANFIALGHRAEKADMKAAAETLVKKAEADSVALEMITLIASHYLYDPNSPMYSEEDYLLFLEPLIASSKTGRGLRERLEWERKEVILNRQGVKAADICFITREGEKKRLYEMSNDRDVLLIFYNPDCDQCKEILPKIEKDKGIKKRIDAGELTVLAIYPGEEKEKWKEMAKDMPEEWIVGIDDGKIINEDTYILRAMPSIYLLDKDKVVRVKDDPAAALR